MKKLELNQMENLEAGSWSIFAGQLAFGAICTFVGVAAGAATLGAGAIAGFACGAMFSALNVFNT